MFLGLYTAPRKLINVHTIASPWPLGNFQVLVLPNVKSKFSQTLRPGNEINDALTQSRTQSVRSRWCVPFGIDERNAGSGYEIAIDHQ